MNQSILNEQSYSLYDAYRDIQFLNYQKKILELEEYCYKFPHHPDQKSTKVAVGESNVAYCKSAFNKFIFSDIEFEEALNSGGHHPITGAYNIGDISRNEDILVCIDNITLFYDRVWCITKSAGTLNDKFRNYGKSAFERSMHLYMPPYSNIFSPMMGIIGTVPRHKDVGSGRGGDHGGNLDLPCVKAGAKIILPSYNRASDIWFGDIHAQQGEGELAGVALECSGEVRFRIFPIKLYKKTKAPIIINASENGYSIYFVGCRNTFSNAVKAAMNNAIRYESIWGTYGFVNSYEQIGLFGDLIVGQAIGKTVSVAIKTQITDIGKIIESVHGGVF